MPHYLVQWRYKDPQIKAMVDDPQDREAEMRKAVESFGGQLHSFFLAFGDYDGAAIAEFPDNESCAACSLTLSGAGGSSALKTTVLLTMAEARQAMKKAGLVVSGYRAPSGISESD